MARWLPHDPESFVLELGPGTGAVTEALLKRGLREDRLVTIEHNPKMARLLRKHFPHAHIITGDAWQLDDLLRNRREPIESVGAVISSLPLLNFPPEKAEALAQKIRAMLEPTATGCNTAITSARTRSAVRPISSFTPPKSSGSIFRPPASVFTGSNTRKDSLRLLELFQLLDQSAHRFAIATFH